MKEPLIKANRVFKYSITFQETNEESREVSDFSDSGFIIENETDEIGDILKLAQQTYGIYYPISFGVWESTTPEQNAKYFEKGIETYYALFIENEDGTAITEEEYDFITFLLSDGNYNKSEFTDYAVGGVVLGALALGVGGLIAYYYFNKRKKGYPTGSAWTKEHYHDNEDEDYEVEPSKRKVPARNRKYVDGGGVGEFSVWEIPLRGNPKKLYSGSKMGAKKFANKYNSTMPKDGRGLETWEAKVTEEQIIKYHNQNNASATSQEYSKGGGVGDMYSKFDLNKKGNFSAVIGNKNYEIIYRDDKSQLYDLFENNKKIRSSKNLRELMQFPKYAVGGTTTTRPTTTPEVVPDTDTKPSKPKTPFQPKHIPKPKARKYDFILIK